MNIYTTLCTKRNKLLGTFPVAVKKMIPAIRGFNPGIRWLSVKPLNPTNREVLRRVLRELRLV